MGVQVCVSCGISRLSAENRGQKIDEFLSIEDLRWEFGASRAWTYKYLAPHIKSITVKCSTDDGERLCKRYSLDDARRVVAEKARAEVYSVPVKATPGKAAMLHTAARGVCESRRARTSPNISSASAISGRSTRLQRNTAVSAQERRHINSSTVTPGSQSCSATKLSISRGAPHRNSWRQQSRCSETPPTPSNTHAVGIKVTPRNSGTM